MTIAVFTPTRHPGIAVSYYSIARQTHKVDYWLVADQLLGERQDAYEYMHRMSPELKIEAYRAEISENKNGNLAHVSNWALNKARELEVDLLVFLQDYIWAPHDGVADFLRAAEHHPFSLITGNCASSKMPTRAYMSGRANNGWNIFVSDSVAAEKPYPPYELDTREAMQWGANISGERDMGAGCYLTNHAWEINWGALPHALINAGVDFDEDYDVGTQWENTQFSFDINRKLSSHPMSHDMGRVWWDFNNRAIAMPHRLYFPDTHEGERKLDNGPLFWSKNPDLVGAA